MHSREIAIEVAGCIDLMSTIITNFLPSTWGKKIAFISVEKS
jgi:hypothetical protein